DQPAATAQDQPAATAQDQPAATAQPATVAGVALPLVVGPQGVALPALGGQGAPSFAPGGPFDPDLQHALQGIGGPNDPDAAHRQAREQDERLYLADFGKPWHYAVYVTSATP